MVDDSKQWKAKEDSELNKEEKDLKMKKTFGFWGFWQDFGKSIKYGLIEDKRNRKKLLEIAQWSSSASKDYRSFAEYVENL